VTDSAPPPEGWYRDPYGLHQDRWFSAGTPTSLVRDGGTEGHDDPPGYPPAGPPAEIPDNDRFAQDDLRRADEAEARVDDGDLARADEAEAGEEPGGEPAEYLDVLDTDVAGYTGEETV
jgi:hypothetical protein